MEMCFIHCILVRVINDISLSQIHGLDLKVLDEVCFENRISTSIYECERFDRGCKVSDLNNPMKLPQSLD